MESIKGYYYSALTKITVVGVASIFQFRLLTYEILQYLTAVQVVQPAQIGRQTFVVYSRG